jgi:hypothetical protein
MFTYNFKRLLNLIGISLFQKLINVINSKDTQSIEQIKQDIAEYILCFYLYLTCLGMIFGNLSLLRILKVENNKIAR